MDIKVFNVVKRAVFLSVIGIGLLIGHEAAADEPTGYLGHYYNISEDHPDMADPTACWGCGGIVEPNLPLRLSAFGETTIKQFDWYDEQYLSFSRIDEDLTFGNGWWPLNEGLLGDPNYYAVHWEATITAPSDGYYSFMMGSDDDSWLFIDGNLTMDLGSIHGLFIANGSVYLTKGDHSLNIYFAERARYDGGFYFKFTSPVTVRPPVQKIAATIDINPDTLNRASQSGENAVTVYIELPEGYNVGNIDVSSIRLGMKDGIAVTPLSAQQSPVEIGDYDGDGIPDLMVKFDRRDIISIVNPGDQITLDVSGKIGGKVFEGSDTIKVIK